MRKYVLKKDKHDPRDFIMHHTPAPMLGASNHLMMATPATPVNIEYPVMVDLRKYCPPIMDQGTLGSCTAHAITSLVNVLETKNGNQFTPLSRLFVYYKEREAEGTVMQDSGASLRDGMKVVVGIGVPPETDFPYDISQFTQPPRPLCYADALQHRINMYERVPDFLGVIHSLYEGVPVVAGISVFSSFESEQVAQTGMVPIPSTDEQYLGGHAILLVGYDLKNRVIIARNSWGEQWGDKGYFYLPFEYFASPDLVTDMWRGM